MNNLVLPWKNDFGLLISWLDYSRFLFQKEKKNQIFNKNIFYLK